MCVCNTHTPQIGLDESEAKQSASALGFSRKSRSLLSDALELLDADGLRCSYNEWRAARVCLVVCYVSVGGCCAGGLKGGCWVGGLMGWCWVGGFECFCGLRDCYSEWYSELLWQVLVRVGGYVGVWVNVTVGMRGCVSVASMAPIAVVHCTRQSCGVWCGWVFDGG